MPLGTLGMRDLYAANPELTTIRELMKIYAKSDSVRHQFFIKIKSIPHMRDAFLLS
jgi:hypothetical protein